MENNKRVLHFRENGFFVEFKDSNRDYLGFILRRFMSFIIDVFIFAIAAVLIYFVSGVNVVLTSIIIWIILTVYVWSSSVMLNDRTVGMYITKLNFVNYDGRVIDKSRRSFRLGIRAVVWSAIIVMPFLNIAYFIICAILPFFVRTVFPIDFVLKTQVVTREAYINVQKIMTEWDEN